MHVGVADLDKSIAFYSGVRHRADVTKPDYENVMLDDPRINSRFGARRRASRGSSMSGCGRG